MKFSKLLVFSLAALAVGSAAWADEPFRLHRYDAYKAIPPVTEKSQTVFMGNSITNMHEWWEGFGSDSTICNRGNSGGYAYELITNVESVLESKPKKFFIGIGTNDLNSGRTPAATALDIKTLVKRIHISSPDTKIYVQSILPRTGDIYTNVQATNELVKAFIDAEGAKYNAVFIDLTTAMMGIRTNNGYSSETSYSGDGLHPTGYGYREWVKAITDSVNGKNGYVSDVNNYYGGLNSAHGMRLSQFGMFPVEENDVLILGDELIHGGEWHELLGSSHVKSRGTGWGYGGFTLPSAVNWIHGCIGNNSQQKNPLKMFFYFGVADANAATTETLQETFKTNYKAVLDTAHALAPKTKIYIMSLVPTSGTLSYVQACNTKLQELAKEDSLVEYIDIHTPLLNTNGTQDTQYFTSNYLYAKGYVKVANILADSIPGAQKIDETAFEKYYANRTNRNSVGAQLNTLLKIETGDGINHYAAGAQTSVDEAIKTLSSLITATDVSTTDVTTATTTVSNTLSAIGEYLNMPTESSADGDEHWYRITSQRATKSLVDQGNNTIQGAVVDTTTDVSTGEELWKFVKRADGTYDIINQRYGTYLAPTASTISSSNEQPSEGWTLSYSTYTIGAYTISCGSSAQLNQSNTNNNVLNWGLSGSTPNRTDQGCCYTLSEYTGGIYAAEKLLTTGWYTIDVQSGLDTYINNGTNHLTNADTEYQQTTSNFYALTISGAPAAESEAKAFIHLTTTGNGISGSTFQFTALNGHGVQENCTSSRTSLPTSNPALTVKDFDNMVYAIGYWSQYTPGDNNVYVGKSTGSANTFKFSHVPDETLEKYDIWTVSVLNNTNGSTIKQDTQVTLTGVENAGLSTVYSGGYFFLPAGTELTNDNIIVTASNAETATISPVISINKYSHNIYVDYTATALATGWYTIDLSAGNDNVTSSQSSDFTTRINNDAHHVINLDTDARQSATNYYALVVGQVPAEAPAKAFVKVTRTGTGAAAYAVTSANGHGLNAYMLSERSQIASSLANFTSTVDSLYNIQYWSTYDLNNTGTIIIGRSSSNTNYFVVKPADTSAYDIYTVQLKNQVNADEVGNDPQVTLTSADNKGLTKVYDGGVFFVTKGANITADQITAAESNGVTNPRISIANNVITVDYEAEQSSIEQISTADTAKIEGIYDLTGRKLDKIGRPGIYIVNGKKTLVK